MSDDNQSLETKVELILSNIGEILKKQNEFKDHVEANFVDNRTFLDYQKESFQSLT